MKNILIYFHICTINNWQNIVTKLFNKIKSSGLLDTITELRLIVLGTELDKVKQIMCHPKVRIVFHSSDISLYERPALNQIKKDCEKQDFYLLYVHSKGVQKRNERRINNINDWIDMMIYYLIDGHSVCVDYLEFFDAIGTNLVTAPQQIIKKSSSLSDHKDSYHFSGNFWWSKSEYIKTLPENIGPKYLDPEMWIGRGTGILYSLHQSNLNHYVSSYPIEKYKDTNVYHRVNINHSLL